MKNFWRNKEKTLKRCVMNKEEFCKLLKTESPKEILFRYMFGDYKQVEAINLTSSQLQQVIDLKNNVVTLEQVLMKNKKKRVKKNG